MTPPIRALIADDEAIIRQGLRKLLSLDDQIKVVGESSDGPETVAAIEQLHPDLLILDVQMPGLDGFEVLRHIQAPRPPFVVLTTARDGYALRAFEANAVDYLTKPFTDRRFFEAMQRAKQQIQSETIHELNQHLLSLLERLEATALPVAAYLTRVAVKERNRVLLIQTDDIDWMEAADNYVRLHVGAQSYLLRGTMKEMEEQLDPQQFVRIHRSRIVNVDRVREMRPLSSGDCLLILHDGTKLTSSRTYSKRRRAALPL